MALFQKTFALLLCVSLRCNGVQFASVVDEPPLGAPNRVYTTDEVDREVAEEVEKETDRREQMAKQDEGLRLPEAPTEPGCFIRKLKGCPRHPEYSDTTWRRATKAERTMQAGVNRTACLRDVKVAAMKWCGTEDVEVLFVPPAAAAAQEGEGGGGGEAQEQPQPRTAADSEVPQRQEGHPAAWSAEGVQEQQAAPSPTQWSTEGLAPSSAQSTGRVQEQPPGPPPRAWSTERAQEQPGSEMNTPRTWSAGDVQEQQDRHTTAEQPAGRPSSAWGTERVGVEPNRPAPPAWSRETVPSQPEGHPTEQVEGRLPTASTAERVEEQPTRRAPLAWSTDAAEERPAGGTPAAQPAGGTATGWSGDSVQEQPKVAAPPAWATEKVQEQQEWRAPEQPMRRTPADWSVERAGQQPEDPAPSAPSTEEVQEGLPAAGSTETVQQQPEGGAPAGEQPQNRTPPAAWSTEEVGEHDRNQSRASWQPDPTSTPAGALEPAAHADGSGEGQQADFGAGPAAASDGAASVGADAAKTLREGGGEVAPEDWNVEAEDVKYPEPQVADADTDRKPHQVEMTGETPTEPGCFVRTPSGCPKHPSTTSYFWKHDEFAERSTSARVSRVSCEVERKARMVAWCGAEDVEMLFIPPFLPGCYVRTPSGCPNHPTFANISWMREEYGGQLTQPQVNRSACEVARKAQLGEWCGSEDVETLFVPVGSPQQQQDSLPGMDEHHRGFSDAPTEPGCYVRTPSGCPAHPSSANYEWKHDGYAERSTKALTNRTMCEEVRGAAVRRWCGAEDVEMLHVPKPAPGCYMRTPSGCPRHPVFASKTWKHEEYGERSTLARVSRTVCEVSRKASVVKWCGSEDVQMSFVPPDWGSLLKVNATKRRNSREPEIPLPAEPGCFVRTPSGCPNHPLFNSSKWKHEVHGEKRMKAALQRQVCEGERLSQVRHWCGAEDVEMLFVPPIEPGCYMRLPVGCPYHSYFTAPDWTHEEHGEAYLTARWDRKVCEFERKAKLSQWCGTPEVEMLFIPAVLP